MAPKKKILWLAAAGIFLSVTSIIYGLKPSRFGGTAFLKLGGQNANRPISGDKFYRSNFFELKEDIIKNLESVDSEAKKADFTPQIGITSHHLPTALPFISNFYNQIYRSNGSRKVFVVLGPDHFEKCQAPITTSKIPYLTPFGELVVDEEIVDRFLQEGIPIDDDCPKNEHSIAVQTIFIKYLYPDAKIVPLIFSANTSNKSVDQVADLLSLYRDKIAVIASVDFSHYQNRGVAIKIDAESEQMLRNLDTTLLDIKHADSPPVLKLVILLAKKISTNKPQILDRANSFDFTGDPENTTGYINAIFGTNKGKISDSASILFVGDLMFDRAIRQSAQQNGNKFIFEKISDLLADNDLVIANLEGPLTSNKSVSLGTMPGSNANFIFTFDPSLAETLFEENIRVINLGNNHILNFGQEGLDSTRRYLAAAGVDYFGDFGSQKSLIKEIKGTKIGFVNYNQFVGDLNQNIAATIEQIKKIESQADVVVLYAHWGDEYAKIPSHSIKNIAHQFIDSGADLIIGTHPHVIQSVEEYKGKKIYYSLGNFVFDQYFSQAVRKGLGVIVKIDSKTKQLNFEDKEFYLQTNGQTILDE